MDINYLNKKIIEKSEQRAVEYFNNYIRDIFIEEKITDISIKIENFHNNE